MAAFCLRDCYRLLVARNGANNAFAEERQRRIAEYVAERGRAHIAELTKLVDVTEPTIRKDLTVLEQRRLLKRTHGGAIALEPMFEPELSSRRTTNIPAKEAIAAACLDEVHDGSSIYLDSGSTVLQIAQHLAGRQVNVLTNSVAVAEAVVDLPGVRHTLLGGQLRRTSGCFVGPVALATIQQFTVNVAFIGASGLSAEGISEADVSESALKAAVMARARKVVVPIDHTKVGATDFTLIAPLDDVDLVITDRHGDVLEELCREHSVELRVAAPAEAASPVSIG